MNIGLFRKIAEEITPYTDEVALHILGEPLLHPELEQSLLICNDNGLKVNIATNGILSEKFPLLKESTCIKQVNFSLHSYFANPERIELDRYLEPIFSFCEDKGGVEYVNLRLWDFSASDSESTPILEKIESYFDISLEQFIKSKRRSKKLKSGIYLSLDRRFEFPTLEAPFISEHGSCHGVVDHIAIDVNGIVVPCCLDYRSSIALGDLNRDRFSDVILNKRTLEMYEGFMKGYLSEELCRRCSFISRFSS